MCYRPIMTYDSELIVDEMILPGYLDDRLIVRNGEVLRRIQNESKARLNLYQNTPCAKRSKLRVTGTKQQVEHAKERVTKFLYEEDSLSTEINGVDDKYNSKNQQNMVETMMIPRIKVGLVIGKKGETLRMINKKSGAFCQFEDRGACAFDSRDIDEMVKITIKGRAQAIQIAQEMINEICSVNTVTSHLNIPSSKVYLIMGNGNENMRRICSVSGAYCQVDNVIHDNGVRTIIIRGVTTAVDRARKMIYEITDRVDKTSSYAYPHSVDQEVFQEIIDVDYSSETEVAEYTEKEKDEVKFIHLTVPRSRKDLLTGTERESLEQMCRGHEVSCQVDVSSNDDCESSIVLRGNPASVDKVRKKIKELIDCGKEGLVVPDSVDNNQIDDEVVKIIKKTEVECSIASVIDLIDEIKNEIRANIDNLNLLNHVHLLEKTNLSLRNPSAKADELKQLVSCQARERIRIEEDNETLCIRLSGIKYSLDQIVKPEKMQIPRPECPVCYEDLDAFVNIFQCSNGHLVCQPCLISNNLTKCPSCEQKFMGRATAMEQYLKKLFNN